MALEAAVQLPAEAKRLHATLSARAVRFLEAIEAGDHELAPLARSTSQLPAWADLYAYPVQSWPLWVGGAKRRAIHRAAVGMAHLLRRLPEALFGDDPGGFARFFRLDDELTAQVLLQEPTGLEGSVMRCDFLDTADGFKCLEPNTTGCLGGWQVRFFARDLMRRRPIAGLLAGPDGDAVYVDPLEALFRHVLADGRRTGVAAGGQLNVVIQTAEAGSREEVAGMFGYLDREWRDLLDRAGDGLTGGVQVAVVGELEGRRGRVWLRGTEVQAIVEYHRPRPEPAVYRAFKAGRVNLYNSPLLTLVGDKRNLALLSTHQDSERFTPEERSLIRELVPWTRIAEPGEVEWRGERVPMPVLLREQRERLVVKHAFGVRGEGVFIGRLTPPERWEEVVREALEPGFWVVQEALESLPYWTQSRDGRPGPQDVVWGLFACGDRYGGTFLRMAPKGGGGIVNSARGAAEGILLEIADESPAGPDRGRGEELT
jgi:hypothetical protein